jgi:hypothetical protein
MELHGSTTIATDEIALAPPLTASSGWSAAADGSFS